MVLKLLHYIQQVIVREECHGCSRPSENGRKVLDLLKSAGYDLTSARMLSFIDFIMTWDIRFIGNCSARITTAVDNNCMAHARNPVNPRLRKFELFQYAVRAMRYVNGYPPVTHVEGY